MDLRKEVNKIAKRELKLKKEIISKIGKIPEHPNVNRINGNCYTINLTDIRKEGKDLCLSAQYYDFKHTCEQIIDIIEQKNFAETITELQKIIDTGYAGQRYKQIKVHHLIINNLKLMFNLKSGGQS